jgi:PGF-CTERM protein
VVVDYTLGGPEADVSNVGAGTIERIGIDRDGDSVGTRVDVRATVTTVSGKKDGSAIRIATSGNHTLQRGDEVVVVLRPVQNPQNAGTGEVAVTVNSQSVADRATGSVTYEYNDARTTFGNQSTTGETVTVPSVTLSEGGFVAVQNVSGVSPDEVRGHSDYLEAGQHTDVTVRLDEPLTTADELVAQAYTDANGDRRYEFARSGGEEDFPYLNRDGNLMGPDTARVDHTAGSGDEESPTATPSEGDDTTPTPTATPTDGPPTATPTPTPGDNESPTATPADGGDDGDGMTPTPTRDGNYDWSEDGSLAVDSPTDERPGAETPTASPTPGGDGTASATASPTDSATDGTTADGGQSGFGAVLAVLALAGAALLARRRD